MPAVTLVRGVWRTAVAAAATTAGGAAPMHLMLDRCSVRSWRASDVGALVAQANNRKIWLNLRDRFPHPYTKSDGRAYIRMALAMDPETFFAIDVEGQAVGAIGYVMQPDVERMSAEVGYWLGEAFWGRGIVSAALRAITLYAIERHRFTRLFAVPFASNTASCRVLEKAGYVLEARLKRSAIKDGVIVDQLQYAFAAESAPPIAGPQPVL
jgi:ribosomal-protein-alanine N-acetyltransferase